VALLKESEEPLTSQGCRPKRRIVYPFFISRDSDTHGVTIYFPAFPDWKILDEDESRAIARARGLATDYIHALERYNVSRPSPNWGALPEDFDKRLTVSIDLAD
jgi:hypothetical protein